MSKWGKGIELNKGEARAMLLATSSELARQILKSKPSQIDQHLVSLVEKGIKLVRRFDERKGES